MTQPTWQAYWKGGGEGGRSTISPAFSLPPNPTPFQRLLHTQRMKKKVGESLLEREEKTSATPSAPSIFSFSIIPHRFQRMLHTQRVKKKVGELLLEREEKTSANSLLFSLPPDPPPFSMPAMHATHET